MGRLRTVSPVLLLTIAGLLGAPGAVDDDQRAGGSEDRRVTRLASTAREEVKRLGDLALDFSPEPLLPVVLDPYPGIG
jgi:hypothetical protein